MSNFKQWTMEYKTMAEEKRKPANSISPIANHQNVILFDHDWLTDQVTDFLASCQHDWIGSLQQEWELELYNLDLLGFKGEESGLKHSCLSVKRLIFLIREARSQSLTILHQQSWGYTCCLQIAGLGRVRMVVCFSNPQCFGNCTALVTNRLDWSPRRITTYWSQHRPIAALSKITSSYKLHKNRLQLA